MSLRARLQETLKEAMRAKDQRTLGTVRLILAALKDRDIAARDKGVMDGIPDADIAGMLQTMIKQRRESIGLYEQGGRLELAQQEREEIEVIERFMPKQMSDAEVEAAIRDTIAALGASGIKDMGRVMAELRSRHPGQMDFGKASGQVKAALT
ncbi:MAG TPA: GatB/YqeY domain-containing protein [Alphaproteobacteria bacterium]|nr:GatB/YqeY domain-containing protein [Alphaproteobacteria bacterium]